jgi:cytochrome d ubiquinol oxidase subunit I
MRTQDAVTGATGIPVSYGILAATYALLAVAVCWTLRRLAKVPMPTDAVNPLTGPPTTVGSR